MIFAMQISYAALIRIVTCYGLPDPDSDADRHQNVIIWSLGHTPALHKISSKCVGNFLDNPVNPDFGLRTPGSDGQKLTKKLPTISLTKIF